MDASSRQSGSAVGEKPGKKKTQPPLHDTPLERALQKQAAEFTFFQAVRLWERFSGRRPVGEFSHPSDEAIHFGGNPSLAFPATEIRAYEQRENLPPLLRVNFLGLVGSMGVMPTPYSEMMIERLQAKDRTMRDFFDLFEHRLVSLFYRAWARYRFGIQYEQGQDDGVSRYLLSLVGLGTEGIADRQAVPDLAIAFYAGLMGQMPRSPAAAEQILSDFFGIDVQVVPFSGAWRALDPGSLTRFGDGKSKSEQLGIGTVVGAEVWDQQSVIRLRLGPLSLAQYKDFLPDGQAFPSLRSMSRFFCGEDFDVEAQLILDRREAPRAGIDAVGEPPRLGWVSWLFSSPLGRDPDETVLRLWEH